MVFDPSIPVIDREKFVKLDWSNTVYVGGDVEPKEALPSNVSLTRGKGFNTNAFMLMIW